MFSITGGNLNIQPNGLAGQVAVLQVYYQQPGAPVCYRTASPYQRSFTGGAGNYDIYVFTEKTGSSVSSLRANFP